MSRFIFLTEFLIMKRILVLLSLVLVGCGAVDNKKDDGEEEEKEPKITKSIVISYKVKESRTFKDSIWDQLDQLESISDRESAEMELKSKQNPYPAQYKLILTNMLSKLSYQPSNIKRDNSYRNFAMPFTSGDSYKFADKPGVYVDLNNEISFGFLKINDRAIRWSDGRKDSVIARHNVRLKYGKQGSTEIRAWVTDEFPSGLGLFDMDYDDGFVLAFELKAKNKGDFKRIYLKAFPDRLREDKKAEIKSPNFRKNISEKELKRFRKSTQVGS